MSSSEHRAPKRAADGDSRDAEERPSRRREEGNRERDRSGDRDRDKHREKDRDKHREKDRDKGSDRERDRKKDRSRDLDREGRRDRSSDHDREKGRGDRHEDDRDRGRHGDNHRDRDTGREMSRDRDTDKNRERSRDRDQERRGDEGGGRAGQDVRHEGVEMKKAEEPRREINRKENSGQAIAAAMGRGSARTEVSQVKEVWGKPEENEPEEEAEPIVKEKANFGLTGALAKDEVTGNIVKGVVLKWSEPLDSAKPDRQWRLYVFKGEELVETLHIHRQSSYLVGRDDRVADIVVAHPSCSKQHAVIQFRKKKVRLGAGVGADVEELVIPYLLDLQSAHKTLLNGQVVEDSRFYELREKDCFKFGASTREYVLLHQESDQA